MKTLILIAVWVGICFLAGEIDSPALIIVSTIAMILLYCRIDTDTDTNRPKSRHEQIREDLYAYKSITTASPHLDVFKDKNSKENKK